VSVGITVGALPGLLSNVIAQLLHLLVSTELVK
jgi:hypothetical protein